MAIGFFSFVFYVLYATQQILGRRLGFQSPICRGLWTGWQNFFAYHGTSALADKLGLGLHNEGCRRITATVSGFLGWALDDIYLGLTLFVAVLMLPYEHLWFGKHQEARKRPAKHNSREGS